MARGTNRPGRDVDLLADLPPGTPLLRHESRHRASHDRQRSGGAGKDRQAHDVSGRRRGGHRNHG
ncbi:MAG TPA: hypothetical protein VFD01_16135 [Candidatus Dormibacteraeota bacterium]|nr:hypothetical protein [Candidatus Dormibacteraeota bacterium]